MEARERALSFAGNMLDGRSIRLETAAAAPRRPEDPSIKYTTRYSKMSLLSCTPPEDNTDGQTAQEEDDEEGQEVDEDEEEIEGKKVKKVKAKRTAAARKRQVVRKFIRSLVVKIADRALSLAEKRFREV